MIHKDVKDNLSINFDRATDILNLLSGCTLGAGWTKLRLKIEEKEEELKFYEVDNKAFESKILLSLDAIKTFKLI